MMNKKEQQLDELLTRSIAQVLPTKEKLKEKLLSGDKLRIYIGADATGPQLHLGHATNFILLEKFRRLGHKVYVLFGDFTALIGDPTDKSAARVRLTKEQVESHIASWKEQVSKLVDFEATENPAEIVQNSAWHAGMTFDQVIDIASNFTVQQMMERDMFEKRVEEGKPVYLHEFFYPLMQGWDSVMLDVDVEIGGTDQTFNMLAGRTLQQKYHQKDKFVVSTTLLENPKTGKKLMSKSEGGYIALNDTPEDMYGKTMALPDEVIGQMFIDCTFVSLDEVGQIKRALEEGGNPRDVKARLARELVAIYHGEAAVAGAEDHFNKVFRSHEMPEEMPEHALAGEALIIDALVETGLVTSKSEARRMIEQGAIKINSESVTSMDATVKPGANTVLQRGKRQFVRLK